MFHLLPAARQAQAANAPLDPEVIAKRTKRHLDELEVRRPSASWTLQGLHLRDAPPSQRSNYSEPAGAGAGGDEEDDHGVAPGGRTAKGRARQTIISDKGKKPKKSTMNVRTAVLYKKTLAVLIEDSVRACAPSASRNPG